MNIIDFVAPAGGNFIVDIMIWLVSFSGIVGGVVLFTLVLKLITFPFDFASRKSMRKNSLKMEEMRPELEKLQKQYADNKDLYQQKMMALYRKNGYSMFGACLPTILTLVIFIVALNGFTDYSRYQNKLYFYNMSNAYNNVVYSGIEIDDNYITRNEKGEIVINVDLLEKAEGEWQVTGGDQPHSIIITENKKETYVDANVTTISFYTSNGYAICSRKYYDYQDDSKDGWAKPSFTIREGFVANATGAKEENNNLEVTYNGELCDFNTYNQKRVQNGLTVVSETEFIAEIQQEMAAKKFREENVPFLWVKNIWATDSPMKHPVETNWTAFKTAYGYTDTEIPDDYAKLIAKLDKEKTEPNGYFILVVITAATSFVMQLVTAKAQKAQMELQTVNGQGAQTQKMMKWMLPIMMAVFAFMYTAAFSIYIILSSTISVGTTFLINFIVDKKYKKSKMSEEGNKVRGRVFVPKEEEKQDKKEDKKQKKTDDKFAHEKGGDFLSGTADKKHIRGRTK